MVNKKATLKDLNQIIIINKKYLNEKSRNWKSLIKDKKNPFFVIEKNNKIIGFASLEFQKWNNSAWLRHVVIIPEYRKKGFATKLMKKIKYESRKRKARVLMAETQPKNPATLFYLKNGFRKCGYNDRFYSNDKNDTAIFMSYDLK